ncbi:MAG: YdaS family helix-turn-helix protein, partial [Pseudolabrys sp.]
MRDPGLSEAIRAAGGVSELARQIGISQPSVSNWIRIPAERVVSVESATGVDRAVLRPDLYGGKKMAGDIDEVDVARAQEYALIAALLTRAPDTTFLSNLSELRADATPLGVAHAGLAEAASRAKV